MKIIVVNNAQNSSFNDLLQTLSALGVKKRHLYEINGDSQKFANLKEKDYGGCILSGGSKYLDYAEIACQQEFIKTTNLPVFGICYGMQLIGYCFGAGDRKFSQLKYLRHGWQHITLTKSDEQILAGVQTQFFAYEKHQFVLPKVSSQLELLGQSIDGPEIIKVKGKNIFGTQFHPEWSDKNIDNNAVKILSNFLKLIGESTANK